MKLPRTLCFGFDSSILDVLGTPIMTHSSTSTNTCIQELTFLNGICIGRSTLRAVHDTNRHVVGRWPPHAQPWPRPEEGLPSLVRPVALNCRDLLLSCRWLRKKGSSPHERQRSHDLEATTCAVLHDVLLVARELAPPSSPAFRRQRTGGALGERGRQSRFDSGAKKASLDCARRGSN